MVELGVLIKITLIAMISGFTLCQGCSKTTISICRSASALTIYEEFLISKALNRWNRSL
jgi:hypothetical protein